MTSHQGMTSTTEHVTGVEDKTYNLISVLYHVLQGAETSMKYLHDAEKAGDQEMVQFFQEMQECQRHLADRAKQMLMQRMREGNGHQGMRAGNGHGHAMAGERGTGTRQGQEEHR